jgi:hypothetical protein
MALLIADSLLQRKIVGKDAVRLFNSLKHAVERHQLIHAGMLTVDPVLVKYEFELPESKNIEPKD